MRIVFDEVVGSVEKGTGLEEGAPTGEPHAHEEDGSSPRVHADELEHELRLRLRRRARLHAD
jgi:hypothetical protein